MPNGWIDPDATWYGGRPWPRRDCVRWAPSSPPPEKGTQQPLPPLFGPCLLWPNDRPSQQLLSSCYFSYSYGDLNNTGRQRCRDASRGRHVAEMLVKSITWWRCSRPCSIFKRNAMRVIRLPERSLHRTKIYFVVYTPTESHLFFLRSRKTRRYRLDAERHSRQG